MQKILMLSVLILIMVITNAANAAMYGGVEFPGGAASFADSVVNYIPGPNVAQYSVDGQNINPMDPNGSLGIPDFDYTVDPVTHLPVPTAGGCVSLGDGGQLILQFTDNALTISNSPSYDLWIFEVGNDEPTEVSISTNGTTWINVGVTSGATSGIDIDEFVSGGTYSYVRLVDVLADELTPNPIAGADIDAVGAISSVPIPAAFWLLGSGLIGLVGIRRKFQK
jgi:hypothetical protein